MHNRCDLEGASVNINFNALCYPGIFFLVAFSIMYPENDFIAFIIFQYDTRFCKEMTSFPNVDKSVDSVEKASKSQQMTVDSDTVYKTGVVIYRPIF